MKTLITSLLALLLYSTSFAQPIQGDRLLDLVGKPVSDPLFRQLKQQETFYTDAWDQNFTIYISRENDVITEVELENGKLRYGSAAERYGYYKKPMPMQLTWAMTPDDFAAKLGSPTLTSTKMNFSDYRSRGWKIRIFYEGKTAVSICYSKPADGYTPSTPVVKPAPAEPVKAGNIKTGWLLKLENDKASFNWDVFESVINNYNSLKKMTGRDSTDYIGQVYYTSQVTLPGFERTALKRVKKDGRWYFEGFFKVAGDSNRARNLFFEVYDVIKASMKEHYGDDFILASVAKKPISQSPVNWMAQWSLYTNYKKFAPGLPKIKMMWFISGMKNVFKNDQMEYTFKLYIFDGDMEVDFFTWNEPKG